MSLAKSTAKGELTVQVRVLEGKGAAGPAVALGVEDDGGAQEFDQ